MKLLYFNDYRLGVLKGDQVVDVTSAVQNVPHTGPGNLIIGVIERWPELRNSLEKASSGRGVPVAQVKIRAPLPKPVNVDCMAVNYMEDGTRKEPAPINAFHKSPGCVVGHGETMVMPDIPLSIFEIDGARYAELGRDAAEVFKAAIGVSIDVTVQAPGSLPRYELKAKRFFDHRPAGHRWQLAGRDQT